MLIGHRSRHLAKDETGTAAIEEGLMMALVSVVIIAVLVGVGSALNTLYDTVGQ
ncbi:MAG: Flp family type IVb pilin, partial [bacterium]|nr:Flp family type IVb pilin [bacterium]